MLLQFGQCYDSRQCHYIGNSAFYDCSNLVSVTILDGATNIEEFAFAGCTSLTNVTLPSSVTFLGNELFEFCDNLISVTVGNSVTNMGIFTFAGCSNLSAVFFNGNAPSSFAYIFYGDTNVTVYYLSGTTGWSDFADSNPGVLTSLWLPVIQPTDASFVVQTNQFGFHISWASGQTVVVEASTDLPNPVWQPVQTNTLTDGTAYFSDPQWTNFPARFYRLRSP